MKKPRSKAPDPLETLSSKGLPCVGGGLFLLLVPILHGAFRPFGWILLIFGLLVLAMPSIVKSFKAQVQEIERIEKEKQNIGKPNLVRPPSSDDFGRLDPRWGREPDTLHKTVVTSLPERLGSWSPSVFKDIEWRRFEAVCETLFAQAGFTTRSQSHGPDGGVDIWLYSRHAEGAVAVVQCKHWLNQPVGVKDLREFLGVMTSIKLKRGTFATSSTYTLDAHAFAKDNGINALDGAALLKQIASRTAEQQRSLLAVAYEGEFWRPTCASCGIKLVERGKGKRKFWGCTNFPLCKTQIWKSSK